METRKLEESTGLATSAQEAPREINKELAEAAGAFSAAVSEADRRKRDYYLTMGTGLRNLATTIPLAENQATLVTKPGNAKRVFLAGPDGTSCVLRIGERA